MPPRQAARTKPMPMKAVSLFPQRWNFLQTTRYYGIQRQEETGGARGGKGESGVDRGGTAPVRDSRDGTDDCCKAQAAGAASIMSGSPATTRSAVVRAVRGCNRYSAGGRSSGLEGLLVISVRGSDQRHQRAKSQCELCNSHDYLHRRFPAWISTGLEQSCSLTLRPGASSGAPRGSLWSRELPRPGVAVEWAADGTLANLPPACFAACTSSAAQRTTKTASVRFMALRRQYTG